MCVHTWSCLAHEFACPYGNWRLRSGIIMNGSSTLFNKTGTQWNPELINRASLASQLTVGIDPVPPKENKYNTKLFLADSRLLPDAHLPLDVSLCVAYTQGHRAQPQHSLSAQETHWCAGTYHHGLACVPYSTQVQFRIAGCLHCRVSFTLSIE